VDVPLPIAAQTAPELDFAVVEAAPLEYSAAPAVRVALAIDAGTDVRSVALGVEVRIAATRRAYDEGERERLQDVFGRPEQWDRSLRGLHWASLNVTVPPFAGSTTVDLHIPLGYDLDVTANRYLTALEQGHVPVELLFSGTVFYAAGGGRLQVGRIGQEKETSFKLPVAVWRAAVDRHFPSSAWLRLDRASYDRLRAYRARNAHLTWEETFDALLREGGS
jgi:hypothetical protein